MKTGMLAGALYGAELNLYTNKELTYMTSAVFASERMDVAGVPNYIKEVVLGTEACPVFKVAVAPIKTFAREIWLRADKSKQGSQGVEGLTASEIVDVWHYVCNDSEE